MSTGVLHQIHAKPSMNMPLFGAASRHIVTKMSWSEWSECYVAAAMLDKGFTFPKMGIFFFIQNDMERKCGWMMRGWCLDISPLAGPISDMAPMPRNFWWNIWGIELLCTPAAGCLSSIKSALFDLHRPEIPRKNAWQHVKSSKMVPMFRILNILSLDWFCQDSLNRKPWTFPHQI